MTLNFSDIQSPKIDLNKYHPNERVSPLKLVQLMDSDDFEVFTNEWLYSQKEKKQYSTIRRIGGSGDKGRDIIAYYTDGSGVDYYQCKHYVNQFTPSDLRIELVKLCYYTFNEDIQVPNRYYLIASNDITSQLADMLSNPNNLCKYMCDGFEHVENFAKKQIRNVDVTKLREYVETFDYSIVQHIPIQEVIDEHLTSIYGNLRFGTNKIPKPQLETPEKIDESETRYINALLRVYSEDAGTLFSSPETLDVKYLEKFRRHRIAYFSAEAIRREVRDTTVNSDDFERLKDEVYEGVIETYEKYHVSCLEKLGEVLSQATRLPLNNNILSYSLHWVGNTEKKGLCHMLVNDDKLHGWENND